MAPVAPQPLGAVRPQRFSRKSVCKSGSAVSSVITLPAERPASEGPNSIIAPRGRRVLITTESAAGLLGTLLGRDLHFPMSGHVLEGHLDRDFVNLRDSAVPHQLNNRTAVVFSTIGLWRFRQHLIAGGHQPPTPKPAFISIDVEHHCRFSLRIDESRGLGVAESDLWLRALRRSLGSFNSISQATRVPLASLAAKHGCPGRPSRFNWSESGQLAEGAPVMATGCTVPDPLRLSEPS